MSELKAYGGTVTSIFQLIGTLENDITKSIAWTMCRCPVFTKNLIDGLLEIDCDPSAITIKYQEYEQGKGITDLEITDGMLFYAIVEAKRGWILPGEDQLILYSKRKDLKQSRVQKKTIITMSECSEEYAYSDLPLKEANGIPVKHLSWRQIYHSAKTAKMLSSNSEKNILTELMEYLGGIMSMQSQTSNWVYVVALSYKEAGSGLSYVDIVEKKGKYYHPIGGNGWPKDPPNYIAFRYGGRLQSIHHIEKYDVSRNLHSEISELPDVEEDMDYFIYTLGPAIRPPKVVKTGKIYASGRKWAMLDTLLTSDTISEACDISKARTNGQE